MPWEQRGEKRYYYHNKRVGSRVVRRYLGTGVIAELAAATDDLRRLERAIEARECRDLAARLREAEAALVALCNGTDVLARAARVVGGYHCHARGSWRRRRGQDNHHRTGGAGDGGRGTEEGPAPG